VFTWADGVMQDIGTLLPAGTDFLRSTQSGSILVTGFGLGINNHGQIAGATTCVLIQCTFGQLHGALLTDSVQPTCTAGAVGTTPTGLKVLTVTVQDLGSGLRSLRVVSAANAVVVTPPIHLATPRPAVVTATQTTADVAFGFQLEVTDVAGRRTTCTFSQPG
jgi:hypothetical protein